MSQTFATDLFSVLPQRQPPWKEFVFGLGMQSLALLALAWVGVLHPEVLLPLHDNHYIQLVSTPPAVNHEPAPMRFFSTPTSARLQTASPDALRIPAEVRPKSQQDDTPVAPRVEVAARPLPTPPVVPVIPRQLVKTNVFSTGSSQTPTMSRAPQHVQTGGFGDPRGVPARANDGKPVTIAGLGSFDLPSGPGYGNGSGGTHGAPAVVASAGFGNGVAIGDGSGRANNSRGAGAVRSSGFGDAEPAEATSVRPRQAEAAVKTLPAEVISKPIPVYTDEARDLRIEGEVLLEVVFESSGRLRVARVVRGLGHGLDESAIRAAEKIRFKPALRDGRPADSTAVLHILFQLA